MNGVKVSIYRQRRKERGVLICKLERALERCANEAPYKQLRHSSLRRGGGLVTQCLESRPSLPMPHCLCRRLPCKSLLRQHLRHPMQTGIRSLWNPRVCPKVTHTHGDVIPISLGTGGLSAPAQTYGGPLLEACLQFPGGRGLAEFEVGDGRAQTQSRPPPLSPPRLDLSDTPTSLWEQKKWDAVGVSCWRPPLQTLTLGGL